MTAFDRDLEGEAERVARRAPDRGGPAGWEGDGQVAAELRSPVEEAMGIDLADVRVRTGVGVGNRVESLGGDALAQGDEIHFAPGRWQPWHPSSRELLRHELVHVAQQRAAPRARPARRGRLQLGLCSEDAAETPAPPEVKKSALEKLRTGDPIVHDEGVVAMKEYEKMTPDDRDKAIADLYSYNAKKPPLQNLLEALTKDERVTTYAGLISDMLHRVQSRATEAAAGMDFAALAKKQGAHMEAQAKKDAAAAQAAEAKKLGKAPPKTVSSAAAGAAHAKKLTTQAGSAPAVDDWTALGDKGRAAWPEMAKGVRKDIVAAAAKKAPHMKLKETDITLDPVKIAEEEKKWRMSIFSLSGRPMTVGVSFIAAAKANPEYVLGSVFHEIYGHPMYGQTYALKLYDESKKSFPSYTAVSRDVEIQQYSYPEDEIYAEMIESDYPPNVSEADKKKKVVTSDDPATSIAEEVQTLISNLEPSVVKAVLLGMWERYRVDPRVPAKGLKLYKDAVNKELPGTIK